MNEFMESPEPKFVGVFVVDERYDEEVHFKHYDEYQFLARLYAQYEYADANERKALEAEIIDASHFAKDIEAKYKIKLRLELKQYAKAYARFSKYL